MRAVLEGSHNQPKRSRCLLFRETVNNQGLKLGESPFKKGGSAGGAGGCLATLEGQKGAAAFDIRRCAAFGTVPALQVLTMSKKGSLRSIDYEKDLISFSSISHGVCVEL